MGAVWVQYGGTMANTAYLWAYEAAHILGKNRRTIIEMVKRGDLEGHKVGRVRQAQWRVSAASVKILRDLQQK
jgi:excisionase family DNA binding protein